MVSLRILSFLITSIATGSNAGACLAPPYSPAPTKEFTATPTEGWSTTSSSLPNQHPSSSSTIETCSAGYAQCLSECPDDAVAQQECRVKYCQSTTATGYASTPTGSSSKAMVTSSTSIATSALPSTSTLPNCSPDIASCLDAATSANNITAFEQCSVQFCAPTTTVTTSTTSFVATPIPTIPTTLSCDPQYAACLSGAVSAQDLASIELCSIKFCAPTTATSPSATTSTTDTPSSCANPNAFGQCVTDNPDDVAAQQECYTTYCQSTTATTSSTSTTSTTSASSCTNPAAFSQCVANNPDDVAAQQQCYAQYCLPTPSTTLSTSTTSTTSTSELPCADPAGFSQCVSNNPDDVAAELQCYTQYCQSTSPTPTTITPSTTSSVIFSSPTHTGGGNYFKCVTPCATSEEGLNECKMDCEHMYCDVSGLETCYVGCDSPEVQDACDDNCYLQNCG